MKNLNKKGGFTLIEILVVLGIIAILAAIVIVAVNPKKHFDDALASTRSAGANSIINAIGQYIVGEKGVITALDLPPAGNSASAITVALCQDLIPKYSGALPTDPDSLHKGAALTNCANITSVGPIGYTIEQTTAKQIIVCSMGTTPVCASM